MAGGNGSVEGSFTRINYSGGTGDMATIFDKHAPK